MSIGRHWYPFDYVIATFAVAFLAAFIYVLAEQSQTHVSMRYELACTASGGIVTVVMESDDIPGTNYRTGWWQDGTKQYIQQPGQVCWVREIPR